MLMVNGLTAGDIASRGFPVLDLYLAQMAANLKKKVKILFHPPSSTPCTKVGAVERVEEQCAPLNGLTYGQVRAICRLRPLCAVLSNGLDAYIGSGEAAKWKN